MTDYFVGPGGSDAANGTTYALRKLTLTGVEALALVAGDRVIAAPGVYPETLTLAKSGGNVYTTGTVSVTNGSKVVTGSGTTFTGNVFANGVWQVRTFVNGTDMVTDGSATVTSAAGNFQAGMVGYVLSIMTKGAYRIASVTNATTAVLENADGSGAAPSAGTGLTYSIAQPESPYDIASVDSNTQITLAKPWSGPTLTGIPYRCWRPIIYIADVTGQLTDGVGGPVVISASNDQATQTRTSVLSVNTRTQRTMRGFSFQLGTDSVNLSTASDFILEDFFIQGGGAANTASINITGLGAGNTFRRGIIQGGRGQMFGSFNATAQDDAKLLLENLIYIGAATSGPSFARYGNSLIRNCTLVTSGNAVTANTASSTTGQAVVVTNNLIMGAGFVGLSGSPTWLFEDYNAVWAAPTAHSNTTVGSHTLTTTAPLLDLPLLPGNGHREDWNPWDLQSITSSTSPFRNKASAPYPADDLYGVERPQGTLPNWGAIEAPPRPQRETVVVRNGTSALKLPGRGYHDMLVPVTFGQAITITAYSRHDSDASIGLRPRMRLLADYGVAEQTAVSGGDGTTWSTLTIGPITPVAPATGNTDGGMMVLKLENRNTNASSIAAYFDDVTVS